MIVNITGKCTVTTHEVKAEGFFQRLGGMIGRRFGEGLDGMWFDNCNAVHSLFMSEAIDVVFLSAENRVLKIYENLAPWRLYAGCRSAVRALELPGGSAEKCVLHTGDVLEFKSGTAADCKAAYRKSGEFR